ALHNDTVSLCSTSNVQEKTKLSRSRCMHMLREVKKQFKFLSETLQDFGTMPIFKRTFSQDLDILEQHLTKDILSQTDCKTTLKNLRTKFENAFNLEFKERMHKYTRFDAQSFKDAMICTMDSIGKYMLEIILHQQWTPHLLKQRKLMQTQEDHSNLIRAFNVDSLKVDSVVIQNLCSETEDSNFRDCIQQISKGKQLGFCNKRQDLKGTRIEPGFKRAFVSLFSQYADTFTSTMLLNVDLLQKQLDKDEFQEDGSMPAFWGVNKRLMQMQESKINTGKAVNDDLIVTESSGTESEVQDDNSRPGNDTDVDDADIRPVYNEEPMAKHSRTKHIDVRYHFIKEKVEKGIVELFFVRTEYQLADLFTKALPVERNSSKNMPRFSLNDMVHHHYQDEAKKKKKERDRNSKTTMMTLARFQSTTDDSKPKPRSTNHSSRSLPISKSNYVTITAMPKADHSKSPNAMICTMDSIGKYMLEIILHQQWTPHLLKQKKLMQTQEDHSNPIRALNVDSLKVDSVVIQNLCSETEDSNSKTASSKSVKESSLDSTTKDKSTLLNTLELRLSTSEIHYSNTWVMSRSPFLKEHVIKDSILEGKLKGNSVDTKFANTSVLGKPVRQPLRNQSVVRQPNAFKIERPQMSKQRFASQVDRNHNLSKPVTQHYFPKKSESAFAKPDNMIASSSSRNSSKNMPQFSLNDMVHHHYQDEAKKKKKERDRNSKTTVMTPARFQSTTDDSKPKPRSTNHSSRSLPISKSNYVTITAMPKADHSKSPSSFSDPTRFFCSTCNKCVFNANHDACITKLLKEVNSREMIQSYKTRNHNKPIDQKSHTQIPGRQIFIGHTFSPNKTYAVYEKISPRSDLRWKLTGRIFKSIGLRWLPTGKLFDSCISKVESEPPHGSNVDISKIHEYKQTLYLRVGTSINVPKEQSLDVSADVLIIQSTPTSVVPIVDEATTQNDGTEEADRLELAFPSLNPILGVGSASIGSFNFAGSIPPIFVGSTPLMSPCVSPISADRHSISAGKSHVSAGRPTGSTGRLVSASRPSGFADRTPIFDCPKSGIFTSSSYDKEFFGLDANNLESSLDVSSTITKRIHNIQPTSQVLGDINSLVQTRRQVWVLVTLPDEKRAIGTKWILKNKRDARGIVCRNKARLVAQGYRHEEGIDYTDVFGPVARIEAIRLFLAFASFMRFRVYQTDVKSAFLYGKIAEEVYVTQPKGFKDPDHPKKVYKVVKALYGLHQAPRACLVPVKSNSYYQAFNVKSLFGEIDCPKKSQVMLKCQIKVIHVQGDLTALK
nr:copia protein [Tanacetum cinerariifolium]